jgi:hypothetical protein
MLVRIGIWLFMGLEIIEFIHLNPCWEELLAAEPYSIKTKRDSGFVLLKYDQIRSDMTIPLVRECRGIILDESRDYHPACVPFFKFGNFGESYIPNIDWSTARVQEKLDGSLIKLWYYNEQWRVSSNGEIDAHKAHISSALLTRSIQTELYTLFMEAWDKTGIWIESLDKNYTYMFELTSPHNRVVVKYTETSIRHIGTRDMRTLRECDVDIGILKPREFPLDSLGACIDSASKLGYDNEGYVVVDANYNRVKVKSPLYVALNHISQGVTTHGNIVEIIAKNEQGEFLTYFPEFTEVFTDIVNRIELFSAEQTEAFVQIKSTCFETRKALAEIVTKTQCPACLFALIDGKAPNARDWLLSRPSHKVLDYIGMA